MSMVKARKPKFPEYEADIKCLVRASNAKLINAWTNAKTPFNILPYMGCCLTQIKGKLCGNALNDVPSEIKKLVGELRRDPLIPNEPSKLRGTRRMLERFAHWQTKFKAAAEKARADGN